MSNCYRVRLVPAATEAAPAPPLLDVEYNPGQTVAQAVYLSGLFLPPALCSGLAVCGRCRMRFIPSEGSYIPASTNAEKRCLSPEDLAYGLRLACRHTPCPGLVVELPAETVVLEQLPSSKPGAGPGTKFKSVLFLAVDLGTTFLQWRLFALENDTGPPVLVWEGGEINPQMGAGSDVISRIAFALTPGGRERLHSLTLDALRRLTARSAIKAAQKGFAGEPGLICLAGNPAMTALALGLDVAGLAAAPLSLPYQGGHHESLPGLPPMWIAPQISPFVGGDISSGFASLAFGSGPPPDYPFLLADMGTNGEFLLAVSPQKALAASVALGPALEGTGLTHGTLARPGAVVNATITPKGLALTLLTAKDCRHKNNPEGELLPDDCSLADLTVAVGITGAGYLAVLDALLRCGGMDREGRFIPGNRLVTVGRRSENDEGLIALPFGLALYASDVEESLKVKAAFSMGLKRLLDEANISPGSLSRIYLSGSLGLHAKTTALENLGFVPPGLQDRITVNGNSSLAGASLLATSPRARQAVTDWSRSVTTLDLAVDTDFVQGFASHMRFSW